MHLGMHAAAVAAFGPRAALSPYARRLRRRRVRVPPPQAPPSRTPSIRAQSRQAVRSPREPRPPKRQAPLLTPSLKRSPGRPGCVTTGASTTPGKWPVRRLPRTAATRPCWRELVCVLGCCCRLQGHVSPRHSQRAGSPDLRRYCGSSSRTAAGRSRHQPGAAYEHIPRLQRHRLTQDRHQCCALLFGSGHRSRSTELWTTRTLTADPVGHTLSSEGWSTPMPRRLAEGDTT
jgi:hypothetical protein